MVKIIANLVANLSRLFGGNGTSIGGLVATKLDKNILTKLSKNVSKIIVVTGTNGKTTTSNLIASCFSKPIIHNSKGANMYYGVVSAFLQNKGDVAVLEVDEGSIPKVLSFLDVDYLVVTNFFRDQLDRYSEIDMLVESIKQSVQSHTHLILNANDPFTMRLDCGNSTYYGFDTKVDNFRDFEISESKYCPNCGRLLNYDKVFYLQIGSYSCECGFRTPIIDVVVNKITRKVITINNKLYNHNLIGDYNALNLAATYAVCKKMDLDPQAGFLNYYSNDGRMQSLVINNHECIVTLAKNPSGMNLSLSQIDDNFKNVLFTLNDNYVDGLDISWIWDADFEILTNEHKYFVNGTRKEDMAVRLKYAGINKDNIIYVNNIEQQLDMILAQPTFSVSSYTAVDSIRKLFEKRLDE